jgi:signal transduction histidine kinase
VQVHPTMVELLAALVALNPDGLVSFDAERRANHVSPSFGRLTGLADSQVLGASEAQVEQLLHGLCDTRVPWRPLAVQPAAPPAGEGGATPRRTLIELLHPQRRMLEVSLRQAASGPVSRLLTLRDVTHERGVQQLKSEFLSTAAHELRTPMASVFGFVELLMLRNPSPERRAEMLATIHRQTKLMITIVNEMLDLARIEALRGKDFELETADLGELVREALSDFSPPQGRELPQLQGLTRALPVRVDRNKMRQALGNVLSNAYKYSPDGGPVWARTVAGDGEWGVQVQDSGIGMTPEQLARVSERFYRADTSGRIPGTGLGMSIVKEIVELLGGRLTLVSQPRQGTTVTLWLPPAPVGDLPACGTPDAAAAPTDSAQA